MRRRNPRPPIPKTAAELLEFYPLTRVERDKFGNMAVYQEPYAERMGRYVVKLFCERSDIEPRAIGLGLTAQEKGNTDPDAIARLHLQISDGTKRLTVIRRGITDPAESVEMAARGTMIFAGLLGLSPEERTTFDSLSGDTLKASDHMDPHALVALLAKTALPEALVREQASIIQADVFPIAQQALIGH